MKKVFISILAVLVLLVGLVPVVAFADTEGQSTGSFTTQNVAPTVDSVVLYTTGGSPVTTTAMSPLVEYNVKVGVTDANTLNDLDTVVVTIYYDSDGVYDEADVPSTGNTQTVAILTCDVGVSPVWSIDPTGGGTTWSQQTSVQPTPLTATTGTFEFHFTPGKVATEATGKWYIYAKATDKATDTGDSHQDTLDMNWYGQIAVSGSVEFGAVALDCDDVASSAVSATYICNGDYSEQVKTTSPWTALDGSVALNTAGTPGAGEFSLKADDGTTLAEAVQILSADYVDIATDAGLTLEAGDTTADNTLWLSLGSSGIPRGTYTGTVYYQIAN
jgi:hypothetical protein